MQPNHAMTEGHIDDVHLPVHGPAPVKFMGHGSSVADPAPRWHPGPVTAFDDDIAVIPIDDAMYSAQLTDRWDVVKGPNGGYLAAIAGNAIIAECADPARQLRSMTIHYHRPPKHEPVRVGVELLRAGRSLSSYEARMWQGENLILTAIAALSMPWTTEVESWFLELPTDAGVPNPAPRDSALIPIPVQHNFKTDLRIAGAFFEGGTEARTGGWIRTLDPRPLDALALIAFSDALPPAGFTRSTVPFGAPTIDLTVHIRATLPLANFAPDDFVFTRFTTQHSADGLLDEDGLLWAPDGTLLAQSRQLALAL